MGGASVENLSRRQQLHDGRFVAEPTRFFRYGLAGKRRVRVDRCLVQEGRDLVG